MILKLKTKKTFSVSLDRTIIQVIVRLVINDLLFDGNSIKVSGYYYWLDNEGNINKLSDLGNSSSKSIDIVKAIENTNIVPDLSSNKFLCQNITQRVKEFTMLQLEQESGENWGTVVDDWTEDLE